MFTFLYFKVVYFTFCGSNVTCASFLSRSHVSQNFIQVANYNFIITTGYNKIILDQPLTVYKGYMLLLSQTVGTVAVDTSGTAVYSDLAWNPLLSKINAYNNYRFYLLPLTNFSTYQTAINLYHMYTNAGLYNVSLTSLSSNQYFQNTFNITDCKFFS